MHGGSWIVKHMVHHVFHCNTLTCYEHILFKQQVPRDGAKEGPVGPKNPLGSPDPTSGPYCPQSLWKPINTLLSDFYHWICDMFSLDGSTHFTWIGWPTSQVPEHPSDPTKTYTHKKEGPSPLLFKGTSCHRRVAPMVNLHPQSSPPPFSSQHRSKHKCSGSPPSILW